MSHRIPPQNQNPQLNQAQQDAANLLVDLCAGNAALANLSLARALDSFNSCRAVAIVVPVCTVQ